MTPNLNPPSQAIELRYDTHGVELLGSMNLFPHSVMLGAAKHSADRRDKVTGGDAGGYGLKREFHDMVCDGDRLWAVSPHFFELYLAGHGMAQKRLPEHVVNFSPWRKSAMTFKAYNRVGDQHGWHVETNGLTVILCVEGEGRLDFTLDGRQPDPDENGDFHLAMRPGQAYLLRGHDVWHRVPPVVATDLPRTTIVMNYYLDDDFSRPDGLDEQHYA